MNKAVRELVENFRETQIKCFQGRVAKWNFCLWNTLELARAIEELQSEGVEMTAEQLRHLSPMDWEHISLTGNYTWDFTLKNTLP